MTMTDAYLLDLLAAWERADAEDARLAAQDLPCHDPSRRAAAEAADAALAALLRADAQTHRGLLLKLMVALRLGDFVDQAIDGTNRLVAPRALVSLWRDLDRLAWRERHGTAHPGA